MTFKILSFKAENFRSLRGIELEFSTQIDKPLTVIRAENGSGKTTILEAMKWCLFGDRALPRKRAEYPMIPSDWNELEGIDQKAIIATEMMFEISSKFNHREDESIKYKIRRECSEKYVEYENADVVNSEDVFLYKCTKLGQIQQEDAEQQIEYVILRNNLKDVFFTDGDAVNAKISNSSPTERAEFVKNTVKTLLGVEIIEKMYSRLDNQTKRIDREIRTVAGAGDLSTILDTLETKKDNLDDLKEKLNQINNKKSNAQKVYDLRDQDLKNCLAAGGQDRKDLLDQLRSAEARYRNAEASVESSYKTFARSLNNDLIAPLIASKLFAGRFCSTTTAARKSKQRRLPMAVKFRCMSQPLWLSVCMR